MNEHKKALVAQDRVESHTGFYIHFAAYVVVIAGLLAVDLLTGPVFWVHWPLLGWGIGILAHAWAVFGRTPRFITNWQVRKIKAIKDGM